MKQLMNFIAGKMPVVLIALLISVHAASATPVTGPDSPVVSSVNIRHLGNVGNYMYFKVELSNPGGEKFSVVLKDQDGAVLFHETYNDKAFSKTFQILKEDASRFTFVVKNGRAANTQSFEINTNTRIVEEVVVRKTN